MVGTAGVTAAEFTELAAPWIKAMADLLAYDPEAIDTGDYATEVQSVEFNKSGPGSQGRPRSTASALRPGREPGRAPPPVRVRGRRDGPRSDSGLACTRCATRKATLWTFGTYQVGGPG